MYGQLPVLALSSFLQAGDNSKDNVNTNEHRLRSYYQQNPNDIRIASFNEQYRSLLAGTIVGNRAYTGILRVDPANRPSPLIAQRNGQRDIDNVVIGDFRDNDLFGLRTVLIGGTSATIGDRCYQAIGNDSLFGEGGNDRITGGSGNDTISGGTGRDLLLGDRIPPTLIAGVPVRFLDLGLDGNDILYGGTGSDTLTGNGGSDIFAFKIGEGSFTTFDADIITDFQLGTDKIGLIGTSDFSVLSLRQFAEGTVISVVSENLAFLPGILANQLQNSANFVIVDPSIFQVS